VNWSWGKMYSQCADIYTCTRRHFISDDHVVPDAPSVPPNTTKDMMRMYVSASWRFGGLGGEMCI
jgi:hypothetical protein